MAVGTVTMTMAQDPYSTTPDCCEVWPKLRDAFSWMAFAETPHVHVMPCIRVGHNSRWRVNHCPSCGANRRLVTWNTEDD